MGGAPRSRVCGTLWNGGRCLAWSSPCTVVAARACAGDGSASGCLGVVATAAARLRVCSEPPPPLRHHNNIIIILCNKV